MNKNTAIKAGLIASTFALALLLWPETKVRQPNGVLVKEPPQQRETSKQPFFHKGYTITPLYDYELKARILGKNRFYMFQWADLSPIDLALGWDLMSSNHYLNQMKITQSRRWYWVKPKNASIREKTVFHNSANVHIIPANKQLEKLILSFPLQQLITLKGHLVRVDDVKKNKWWISSTSRTDRGDGSCEVFYVTDAYTSIPDM